MSASAALLSGRYPFTRANRSARPPGYCGLACRSLNATSTTSSGRTWTVCPSRETSSSCSLVVCQAEQLVGHPLERLAEHHKAAADVVPSAKVKIAEPAAPAAVPPLGGEHDEVQCPDRLHLEPPASAAAGLVGRVERLGHDALVPARERVREEALGLLGRRGLGARHQERWRYAIGQLCRPAGERLVEQRDAVEVEQVEEKEREGRRPAHPLDVEPAAESGHRGLKRVRDAVGAEGDRLALEDQLARGEHAHGVDDLGHRRSDLVEPPGVYPDLLARLVDLDPGAVQLALERGLAQLGERLGHAVRAARQHREHRPEELHREAREPRGSLGQRRAGDVRQVARHHDGPAHVIRREAGRASHRLDHQRVERALAELAHDEAEQKLPLVVAEPREQFAEEPPSRVGRALAGGAGDALEGRVQLGELDAGLRRLGVRVEKSGTRRRHRVGSLQAGPAEAELLLADDPAEVGGGELDLIGGHTGEQLGQEGDLVAATAGGRDAAGGVDQGGELQGEIRSVAPAATV